MSPFSENIILVSSFLAIIGQVFVLFSAILFVTSKESPRKIALLLPPIAWLWIAFLSAFASTFGSLYFSRIAGLEVCTLCWFQRIFMYPQLFLLGIALWTEDFRVKKYSIMLSLFGAVIALFHYIEQMSQSELVTCAANGSGPSCLHIYFTEFGYITFPILALTSFLVIIVCTAYASMSSRDLSVHNRK